MHRPDVVRGLVRDGAVAARNLLLRRGMAMSMTAAATDRIAVSAPPLMTQGLRLGDVDLSELGKAFHYRPARQASRQLGEALDEWCRRVRGGAKPIDTSRWVLEQVAGHDELKTSRLHELAPLAIALFLPSWEGFEMAVSQHQITTVVDGVGLWLSPRLVQGRLESRRLFQRLNPQDVLVTPMGSTRQTTPLTGAAYQMLLQKLPDFRTGITAIVGAAVHGGMQEVFQSEFDVRFDHDLIVPDQTPWDIAISLIENAQDMPYYDLRDTLRSQISNKEFHQVFEVPARWRGRTYSQHMRAKHRESLLALRLNASEPSRLSPTQLADRSEAQRLIHLQQQIR
jgi:hypothetical protein